MCDPLGPYIQGQPFPVVQINPIKGVLGERQVDDDALDLGCSDIADKMPQSPCVNTSDAQSYIFLQSFCPSAEHDMKPEMYC